MDKSGFFSSLGAYLKANMKFFLVVLLILVSTFGYFWYRSGFTLQIGKFFAAQSAVVELRVNALSVEQGGSVRLDWTVTDADSCTAISMPATLWNGPWNSSGGFFYAADLQQTTEFKLECQPGDGTFNVNSVVVTVIGAVPPVCNNNGNCDAGETTANCSADCPASPPVSTTCDKANIQRGVPSINVSGNPATSRVTNNNGVACTISLASYEVWSNLGGIPPHYIEAQKLFGSTTVTVGAGQTANLSVGLPNCYSQVDLIIGEPIVPPNYSPGYFLGVENWDVGDPDGTQRYCNEGVPTPTPTATVTVTPTPTPSATATPAPLACSPVTQIVALGAPATITGSGGTASYGWYAPGSNPVTGTGASFIVTYTIPGEKTVTMTGGGNQVTCQVVVAAATPTPTPTTTIAPTCQPRPACLDATPRCLMPEPVAGWCPTPTPSITTPPPTTPQLALQKMVRNITQGSGEGDSTNANPTDTVEFSLRVSSVGTGLVTNVMVRDALPAGLSYIPGATTVDGAPASDGVISTGLNLGDMSPGRTITVRFRATVAPGTFFASGTSVLTNTGYARGSNVPEVSDVAFVTIVNTPQNLTMSLIKMGRNVTRGETGEHTPVLSSPGQTIEFILRVRNTSNAPLTNVMLRDIVPTGIAAVPGSVRIGSSPASDALFGAGLNLGTLSVGQEVVVIFSGRVAVASELPAGTTTLINTVQATATGVGMLTAQLPVIITSTAVVVPPVDTGPGESTVLALIISGIITLLYVGYTGTDTYRRHEAGELVKESKDEPFNFGR